MVGATVSEGRSSVLCQVTLRLHDGQEVMFCTDVCEEPKVGADWTYRVIAQYSATVVSVTKVKFKE